MTRERAADTLGAVALTLFVLASVFWLFEFPRPVIAGTFSGVIVFGLLALACLRRSE